MQRLRPTQHCGQRLYRKGDVESVLLIKRLLYLERYSIEGAKKRIKELERELLRKDRALAETAALLVLSKKVAAIFNKGEGE